jgi:predicted DNA-binding protein (MmcQ/YjbR family)
VTGPRRRAPKDPRGTPGRRKRPAVKAPARRRGSGPRTPPGRRKPSTPRNPSPHFRHLQRFCLGLPDVSEEYPWGDIVWKVRGRMFAACGPERPLRVTFKPDPVTALAIRPDPAVATASYVGRFGWLTVTVTDARTRALALALVRESYDVVSRGAARSTPAAKSGRSRRP